MTISKKGIDFIKRWEAFEPFPADDGAGFPTIGYGHKCLPGELWPEEEAGEDGIDEERATKVLNCDLITPCMTVRQLTPGIELLQYEFDALVSLIFNIGSGAFRKSTLLGKLKYGTRQEAADQFLVWRKAGGKVLAGLEKRRAAERKMFLEGIYDSNH